MSYASEGPPCARRSTASSRLTGNGCCDRWSGPLPAYPQVLEREPRELEEEAVKVAAMLGVEEVDLLAEEYPRLGSPASIEMFSDCGTGITADFLDPCWAQ